MTVDADLRDRSTHFEFGENWASYSSLIDEHRLDAATENVRSLLGDIKGRSILDIGSGSGLFALAALRLGASRLLAVDIDENSVATTRQTLGSFTGDGTWQAERISVFDLSQDLHGSFDIVYSWGVLHHTGSMWEAVRRAAAMVAPGGTFAFALYEKTPLCGFWTKEKKFYASASKLTQKALRGVYWVAYAVGLGLSGRNPFRRLRTMRDRGMNMSHDIHDWLGGFPYESTSAPDVAAFMSTLGFKPVKVKPVPVWAYGVLGCGCSEFVYRRPLN